MTNIGNLRKSINSHGNILVVRLDWIGDMVLLSPFLRELRRAFPNASVTLVANKRAENLLDRCPHIDDLICLDVGNSKTSAFADVIAAGLVAAKLASVGFDLALAPSCGGGRLGALAKLIVIGARARITGGYAEEKHKSVQGLDRFLSYCLPVKHGQHEVLSNVDLLTQLGIDVDDRDLEVWFDDDDEQFANTVFDTRIDSSQPVIAIAPGSGSALKEWAPEKFAAVAASLVETQRAQILLLGGQAEKESAKIIARQTGAIDLTGVTTLRQAAALLRRCALLICNDTSLMHIAAALKTPVIALFGASCADRFAPWGTGHSVMLSKLDCSPCMRTDRLNHSSACGVCIYDSPLCMEQISINLVKDVSLRKLADVKAKRVAGTEILNVSGSETKLCCPSV